MIQNISMHRYEFMQRFSIGKILDIGSYDGRGWLVPSYDLHIDYMRREIIFADCDDHEIVMGDTRSRTLRCFAENVPLPDKFVDTVCLGDILEHVEDPDVVIKEAKRLARQRILITVPNEYEWPEKLNPFKIKKEFTQHELDEVRKSNLNGLDDNEFPHFFHVRFYNHESFKSLIEKHGEGMDYILFNIKYSGHFVNFAAMMWFK